MHPAPHHRFAKLPLALLALVAAVHLPSPARAEDRCQPPAKLAAEIVDGRRSAGDLPVEASFALDATALDEGRLRAAVTSRLDVRDLTARRNARLGRLCAAVVVAADDGLQVVDARTVEIPELDGRDALEGVLAWTWHVLLELPETTTEILTLIQEPALGLWGSAIAEDLGEPLPSPGPGAVQLAGDGAARAWYQIHRATAPGASRPGARGGRDVVVRLVPPRDQPVSGSTRFDALTTSLAVRRVRFELDGEVVTTERLRPFVARLPLARPPRIQEVRAVALDADGNELGDDVLRVNELDRPFRVRITDLAATAEGTAVSAEVDVPQGASLDRVELFFNEELLGRYREPRLRGLVPGDAFSPVDYVRVAAHLADGASIDDVVLLASPALTEEVDVNLVELHVVVSDANRRPVGDLEQEDFRVVLDRQDRQLASFAYADDVPLTLGLVVDTSGSMQLMMQDTRKVAAEFLGSTVLPQDQAFLVDFDRQPRLLQDTTSDLPRLMIRLGALQARGSTAMYDAIIFAMLQFERARGRKALVVLTDGDDHESRYSPKECRDLGRRLGVPIYIIGLGALDHLRRTYRTADLRKVTEETGGRLYFVESFEELGWAYAEINAELRSQYTLTFYADRDLSDEERREVEVRLARQGLTARTVLGASGRSP